MLLKRFLLINLILISFLCTKSSNVTIKCYTLYDERFKDIKVYYHDDIKLLIDKINLEVYTTYNTKLKDGLEIHKLSTKPGYNSTIIVMGHSGIGNNVYFNKLYKLDNNDEIKLSYAGKNYIYYIEKIEYISKYEAYPFIFNEGLIYLITCHGKGKQLLIKAKMA